MNVKLGVGIGLILGIVFTLLTVGSFFKIAAPTMIFNEVASTYDFDKTVELIKNRINKQDGWHVTSIIDQQKEIIEYGGQAIGKVKIIKFCNGKLSGEMLAEDGSKFMATNMPLSISVYEKSDGRVTIGLMNGYLVARLFSGTREGALMENAIKDMESILSFTHFRYTIF